MASATTDSDPPRSVDGSLLQAHLEGASAPFVASRDPRIDPLLRGAQGPPLEYRPDYEVAETEVPEGVSVRPLAEVTRNPGFTAVDPGDMVFAGRIPDTSVDIVVFSVDSPRGPEIGFYAFDGDLAIVLATVSEEMAPGFVRSRVGPPEGDVDVVIMGPLDPAVAVVVVEVDDEIRKAVRPRARFAGFNTLGLEETIAIRLLAYDANGDMVHEAVIDP